MTTSGVASHKEAGRHGLTRVFLRGCCLVAAAGCHAAAPAPTPVASVRAPLMSTAPVGTAGTNQGQVAQPVLLAPSPRDVAGAEREERPSEAPRRRVRWLSPKHVASAVRTQHAAFSACRTLAGTQREATETGAITIGFEVQASGRVSSVALDRSSFRTPAVNDCMLSVAREVRFPASPADTEVTWTVHFRGPGRGQLAHGEER